ncbi:DUF4406 domain-containing protein [Mucilaginibacter gossypii]|uniref:DUF4406 domain-containing protein n=1 Tax=Mucilaginibacter gossypii TaxID=551996 RepID=UPI000DCC85B0|nr:MULTISPECIES: DUF4406 domain-containing protein [Mucilaginibacter]QTE37203.1 DUF4406 domain-containing protein [Mucilaginibacter gossypii]RAV57166.1 hypothetical protein DIU36_12640 [Mucilaginibacter rubeus]
MLKLLTKTRFLIQLTTTLTKSKSQVVYIAGKVTGLPVNEFQAKFAAAKEKLQAQGFSVLNPCDFIAPDEDWKTAMRKATTLLNMADHIYMLPDWRDSAGAILEHRLAVKFGLNTMYE